MLNMVAFLRGGCRIDPVSSALKRILVDSPSIRVVSLSCPGCGAALEVGPALTQLACGYCGKVATVERRGATIALLPMVAAIERVQVGTDRTAAELAMVRLRAELAAAEAAWKARDADLTGRRRRTRDVHVTGLAVPLVLLVIAAIVISKDGYSCGSVFFLVVSLGIGILVLASLYFNSSSLTAHQQEAWATYMQRAKEIKAQIEKNRLIVDG
jgi:hypothetical protein